MFAWAGAGTDWTRDFVAERNITELDIDIMFDGGPLDRGFTRVLRSFGTLARAGLNWSIGLTSGAMPLVLA